MEVAAASLATSPTAGDAPAGFAGAAAQGLWWRQWGAVCVVHSSKPESDFAIPTGKSSYSYTHPNTLRIPKRNFSRDPSSYTHSHSPRNP